MKDFIEQLGKMSHSISSIPTDRIFYGIEKEAKKMNIMKSEDYCNIFNNNDTINKLSIDCPVYDWKTNIQTVLKPPNGWHFKLKFCKRIKIKE